MGNDRLKELLQNFIVSYLELWGKYKNANEFLDDLEKYYGVTRSEYKEIMS